MRLFIITITKIHAYFKGESLDLRYYLRHYDAKNLSRDFHAIRVNFSNEIRSNFAELLRTLTIPEKDWGPYLDSNLTAYEFFIQLTKNGYIQAGYVVDLINKKPRKILWQLGLTALFLACLITSILILPPLAPVVAALKLFVLSPVCLPICGCLATLGLNGYNLYSTQSDRKRPILPRIRDNFFLILNSFLTFTAYGIWIASLSTMTPLAACLFVSASLVEIAKELFNLVLESISYKKKKASFDEGTLDRRCARIRHAIKYQMHSRAALINLAAAAVLMCIMAAWCFAYGGILVSAAAVIAIGVVYIVRGYCLKKNNEHLRISLQTKLKKANDVELASERRAVHLPRKTKFPKPEKEHSKDKVPIDEEDISQNGQRASIDGLSI